MFVRLSKHMVFVEEAARSRAAEAILLAENARQRHDLADARKELRRLTNIIVGLKQQGHVLGPEHIGPSWGSYRFDDIEAEQAAPRAPQPEPESGFDEEQTLLAEAEIRAELERVLDEE